MKAKWYLPICVGLVIIIFIMYQTLFSNKDGTMYIAFAGPLSGKAGKIMTQAIQLYFDEINDKGGIREKKLVLDMFDDQNNADMAKQSALKMAEQNRALAVIGHWYSSCSISAGGVYKIYKIPAVTPGSVHPDVARDNDWYFKTIYSINTPGMFLAYYIKKVMQNDSAYVIHEDGIYSSLSSIFKETAREVDLDVRGSWEFKVSHAKLNRRLRDIVSELQAKKDSTSIIVLSVQAPEGVKIIKLLKDAGIENPVIGPSSFSEETFLNGFRKFPKEQQEPGYYTDGIYVMTPLIFDTANQEARRFRETYKARYREEPDWSAAFAYDAAKVIVKAIQQGDIQGRPDTLSDDRKKIRDYLANLTSAKSAVEGTTGLNYFNEYGDAQKPVSIGVYKHNEIISVLTQLRTARNINKISDTEAADAADRIISVGDTYMYKTQIVYTGMDIRKISDLDLDGLTCKMDGYLWFRCKSTTLDVGDIEFLNAVMPIETDNSAQKVSFQLVREKIGSHQAYRLYNFKGQFKVDFHRVQHAFGLHSLGVSFRHRDITADNLIYVVDELGIGPKDNESAVEEMTEADVFSSAYGWGLRNIRFFQDIIIEKSLGAIDSDGDGFVYSRFNLDIVIGQDSMTLRRKMSYQLAGYVMLFSFILVLPIAFEKTFKRFPKQTWLFLIIAWGGMMLTSETFILGLLTDKIRPYYLERIILIFDMLWWMIPAMFIVMTIERFIWIPLESRTGRAVPTIVRRMLSFLIYLLTCFGIIAFVFNQRLTGLLATSGMFAMIIGLALQINISNIFSGIALSVERPFRVGDWVKISNNEGKVIDMTWRTTRIQTMTETVISVPNSVASDSVVENCYYPDNTYWKGFTVYIDPTHPPVRVEKLLRDAVLSVEDGLTPWVQFAGVSEWSASYWVWFSGKDHAKRFVHSRAVWENVWTHLNHAGIEFAIEFERKRRSRKKVARWEKSLAILEETDIFRPFDAEAKSVLSRQMRQYHIPPGEIVIQEGESGDSLFIIAEGVLGLGMQLENGQTAEIARLAAGDIIGEMALLTGEPGTATVKAITNSVLYEITKGDIAPFLEAQPEIAEYLSEILTERKIGTKTDKGSFQSEEEEKQIIYKQFLEGIRSFFSLNTQSLAVKSESR
ncbi:ABC transporter substrate-binding protein [Desulfococcaceae bacterium HSG8]|nr:ABC transporter substrate-binding protein [Desulfococcaceae bacterium HSG8]